MGGLVIKMRKLTRLTIAALICLFSISIFATTALAADYDADARYREGSFLTYGLQHAGLRRAGVGIYEIRGYLTTIQLSDWNTFLSGYTYIGAFINPTMTNTDRTNILSTAAAMDADPGISYTAWNMLDTDPNPGTYVQVSEITDIRCDGVVEYAYEWNYVWVWGKSDNAQSTGTPQHFDVSYVPYLPEHNDYLGADYPWVETSPKVQHGGVGTKWTQLRQYW